MLYKSSMDKLKKFAEPIAGPGWKPDPKVQSENKLTKQLSSLMEELKHSITKAEYSINAWKPGNPAWQPYHDEAGRENELGVYDASWDGLVHHLFDVQRMATRLYGVVEKMMQNKGVEFNRDELMEEHTEDVAERDEEDDKFERRFDFDHPDRFEDPDKFDEELGR
jgi:hypothetical protein